MMPGETEDIPVRRNRDNDFGDDEDPDVVEMERIMALQENDLDGEYDRGPEVADENGPEHGMRLQLPSRSAIKMHYGSVSLIVAIIHIIYVLRTRKQVYLSLLYLTSSKVSYIVIGNAVLAAFVKSFHFTVQYFLNGLRLMETETIVDHIRWNVTETCIALTMFRQEISVKIIGIFLVLILGKCLHWALELRINHLRMTEEVFYFANDDNDIIFSGVTGNSRGRINENQIWWFWRAVGIFFPKTLKSHAYCVYQGIPRIRQNHLKIILLMGILFLFDVLSLTYCASHLLSDGPSVFIMFLFETAVLMTSILSSSTLYYLHMFDGLINIGQRLILEQHNIGTNDVESDTVDQEAVESVNLNREDSRNGVGNGEATDAAQNSASKFILQKVATVWRDQRITATFMVELMALAAKFLFHLILFVAVLNLYGLPINIIRDFYMAFMKLKQRLISFSSYRRLTSNMDSRFKSVISEEELESAGSTCIICREKMQVHGIHGDCKMLPICNHVFHKHCLREWLVQQQSCPTCRGDIQANEARAKAAIRAEKENEDALTEDHKLKPNALQFKKCTVDMMASKYETSGPTGNTGISSTNLALWQVVKSEGTPVFDFDINSGACKPSKVVRDLEYGKIIATTFSKEDPGNQDSESLCVNTYLRISDGWVLASDFNQICALSSK